MWPSNPAYLRTFDKLSAQTLDTRGWIGYCVRTWSRGAPETGRHVSAEVEFRCKARQGNQSEMAKARGEGRKRCGARFDSKPGGGGTSSVVRRDYAFTKRSQRTAYERMLGHGLGAGGVDPSGVFRAWSSGYHGFAFCGSCLKHDRLRFGAIEIEAPLAGSAGKSRLANAQRL